MLRKIVASQFLLFVHNCLLSYTPTWSNIFTLTVSRHLTAAQRVTDKQNCRKKEEEAGREEEEEWLGIRIRKCRGKE